ncbi:hypothetical protein DEFDS_P092 (plasmid) [Deferribacter desulfuricans SSM1]|uniref:Uncharacterized protein n=1 Tax=Deferribacter desulfuricans (strain DSM 14783 / JCM 11476 / NBRC 101012 / SSM1) TaxID=639282 RepID=D3PES3_DEFDS|nr:hypothetical protein [Deferribacter desulfuricans]BAI81715.1 hypothetical protein DEFDS_P092 [Deferribacter desulfuricans SSM1]
MKNLFKGITKLVKFFLVIFFVFFVFILNLHAENLSNVPLTKNEMLATINICQLHTKDYIFGYMDAEESKPYMYGHNIIMNHLQKNNLGNIGLALEKFFITAYNYGQNTFIKKMLNKFELAENSLTTNNFSCIPTVAKTIFKKQVDGLLGNAVLVCTYSALILNYGYETKIKNLNDQQAKKYIASKFEQVLKMKANDFESIFEQYKNVFNTARTDTLPSSKNKLDYALYILDLNNKCTINQINKFYGKYPNK